MRTSHSVVSFALRSNALDVPHRLRGSIDLGNSYVLLQAHQQKGRTLDGAEGDSVCEYLEAEGICEFDGNKYPEIIK